MHRTRIKFCGMMRPEDAAEAARAGADAVGVVFYAAARRRVTVDQAKRIIAVLPPFVTPVGLFADVSSDEVRDVARHLNIRHVQLHGNERPQVAAELRDFTILKAVHVSKEGLDATIAMWRAAIADLQLQHLAGLLLETAHASALGGTGVENDWDAIASAQQAGKLKGLPPIIVAGGLNPENVENVIRRLRPWSVDLSSGVEASHGIKSIEKMNAFVDAVRAADQSSD